MRWVPLQHQALGRALNGSRGFQRVLEGSGADTGVQIPGEVPEGFGADW